MTITLNVAGGIATKILQTITPGTFAIGENLNGMEFGNADSKSVLGHDYVEPTLTEMNYAAANGLTLIRLPVKWEVLQFSLNATLNPAYLAQIKTILANAAKAGCSVILDVHNYGRYNGAPFGGASGPTAANFANLWSQLAMALKGSAGLIGYDLMNEPHDMPTTTIWTTCAQAAITAIRLADTVTSIIVEGNNWASPTNYEALNPGFDKLFPVTGLIFSAHCYLDRDNSGTHYDWTAELAAGSTLEIGSTRLASFVAWLKKYDRPGYVGEIGAGLNNPGWLLALDKALAYCLLNNLWVTYWGAGPWWPVAMEMSAEPVSGVDKPQIAVLKKYSGFYQTVTVATVTGLDIANNRVNFAEDQVTIHQVKAGKTGVVGQTFTTLAQGIHIITAGEALPTANGPIAAVCFKLVTA